MAFKFRFPYLILSMLLLAAEIFIFFGTHDRYVRPYVGDFLATILLYTSLRSFLDLPHGRLVTFVLLYCYTIETLQAFHLIDRLGLQHSVLAHLVLGSFFTWIDMGMYTLAAITILFAERLSGHALNEPAWIYGRR